MESQQSVNPYAPPVADPEPPSPAAAGDPGQFQLASRWQRLGAILLDGLLGALAGVPVYKSLYIGSMAGQGRSLNPFAPYLAAGKWGVVAAVLVLSVMALQAVLITRRGQSVGKILVGTRIVTLAGGKADFVHAVLLRTWLPAAVALIPGVGGLLSLIDGAFIFRSDKRCLHDLIAGTRVVRLEPPARA
jgi:uncharacterized RDD family membrane protein YckC